MLLPLLADLERLAAEGKFRVVLASKSPRRRAILEQNLFGPKIPVEVKPSDFKEDADKRAYFGRTHDYVKDYAASKAEDVISQLRREHEQAAKKTDLTLVISSDTVVEADGSILEKPSSPDDAVQMLQKLGNRSHRVITGVQLALLKPIETGLESVKSSSFHEESKVNFGPISNELAEAYVATGEPLDKAGGYGIQGLGGQLVQRLEGCYYNVMGLPLYRVAAELSQLLSPELAKHGCKKIGRISSPS